ncbi:MAG: hypothetical protein HC896_16520 [Bacteroidales bacterium]|nr:hypothetical protein [Bacteroidales bacterium]
MSKVKLYQETFSAQTKNWQQQKYIENQNSTIVGPYPNDYVQYLCPQYIDAQKLFAYEMAWVTLINLL